MRVNHSYFFSDLPALSTVDCCTGDLQWLTPLVHALVLSPPTLAGLGHVTRSDQQCVSKHDANRGLMSAYTVGLLHLEGSLLEP